MIQYLYLGRVDYGVALDLQEEIAALRLAGRVQNVLLLLEHPPVLTLGRNAKRWNVLASDQILAHRGIKLFEINRGGDVTYHGPGQLVGYPIFDLRSLRNANGGRLGPVDFVRRMEEALIRLCGVYRVHARRIDGLTGVWCVRDGKLLDQSSHTSGERKIGAIGIHVARGITTHGFAFNVTTDLRDFQLINPCGITDRPVTSLEREVARSVKLPTLEAIAHEAARQFGHVYGEQVLFVESLETLRAQAPVASPRMPAPKAPPALADPAPQLSPAYPAASEAPQDTPLQIPREIERLHGDPERPVRA